MVVRLQKNQILIPLLSPENPAEAGSNPAGPTISFFRRVSQHSARGSQALAANAFSGIPGSRDDWLAPLISSIRWG